MRQVIPVNLAFLIGVKQLHHFPHDLVEDALQQFVLALKIVIHQPFRDTGVRCQLADRYGMIARCGKAFNGRIQDLAALAFTDLFKLLTCSRAHIL